MQKIKYILISSIAWIRGNLNQNAQTELNDREGQKSNISNAYNLKPEARKVAFK